MSRGLRYRRSSISGRVTSLFVWLKIMARFSSENQPKRKVGGKTNADVKTFCRAKMKGMTNAEAYKMANPGSISAEPRKTGYKFAHRPQVEAEMERLRRAAEEKAHATPEMIMAAYEDIAFDPDKKDETKIAALDRLSKVHNMFSDNAKVEVAVSMADREQSMRKWLEELQGGETEEPSSLG